jgi:hypothetical protein
MKLLKTILIFSIFISGCEDNSINPSKGNRSWIFLGLVGKQVVKIKTSPSYVYACTGLNGLYRIAKSSYDGQWEYIGLNGTALINGIDTTKGVNSPNTEGVMDVVINPNNENELLAAILVYKPNIPGIYKTTNGGRTWFEADSGYGFEMPWWWPGHVVDSGKISSAMVLFNPANQFDVIFAGHSEAGIVYRTTNSGLTWEQVFGFALNTFSSVESFSQDPVQSNTIFAGGSTSGPMANTVEPTWFSMSTDGGVNWTLLLPPRHFLMVTW